MAPSPELIQHLRTWSLPSGVALVALGLAFIIGTLVGGPIVLPDTHDYTLEAFQDALDKVEYLNLNVVSGTTADRTYLDGMDVRSAAARRAREQRLIGREVAIGGVLCAAGALSITIGLTVLRSRDHR